MGRGYGRAGEELTWTWLNALLKLARGNRINLGPNSGLSMVREEGIGTFLRVSQSQTADRFLGVTISTVSACAVVTAGTKWTPGAGTVYAVSYDGTNLNTNTEFTYDVLNWSTTTGGIDSDTLVWVDTDGTFEFGEPNYYITQLDCGN